MSLAQEADKRGPAARPVVSRYLNAAADVEDRIVREGRRMPISAAEEWKHGYQAKAYPKGIAPREPTQLQMADQAIAGRAKDLIDATAVGYTATDPEVAAKFMLAKRDYGMSKTATRMLEGAEGRAEARNMMSPSDKAATAVAAIATGNPLGALATGFANRQVRVRAASTLAVGARSLSQVADKLSYLVRNDPGKLGPYGAVLSNALRRGGQQAFDAHAFVLGQSDPGFQALVQELGKEQPKLLRGYTVPIDTSTPLVFPDERDPDEQ